MMRARVLSRSIGVLRRASESRWAARARAALLAVVLLGSTAVFLHVVNDHYPIDQWLFWHYARVIACSAVWTLACLCAGHRVLKAAWRRPLPLLEQLTLSMAAGVLVFFLAMFLGGILGLYRPAFAVALPLVMVATTGSSTFRYVRRAFRRIGSARRRPHAAAPAGWIPMAVYGLLGIGMIYFLILTPENAAYDSRWYHLGLAEHYVAEGAIRASPDGSFLAALPQLASILYAWALMLPALPYFDHIELAAHIEFVLFLFTLAGIPVAVRALLPRTRAPLSWTAVFLFPGIFLYDSTLGISADHVAAFWAVPIWVTMARALEALEPRRAALFAAMLTGAMLTKYQASEIVIGPVLVSLARILWLAVAAWRGRFAPKANLWRGPLAAFAAGVILFAPHWLKNLAFYGDPLYPSLYAHLHVHPWTLDSPHRVEGAVANMWRPEGTLVEKLHQTLVNGVVLFSFKPNEFPGFHGSVPVFGSLFSLLALSLPFLRKSGKTILLFVCTHIGIAVWYWVHHEDRTLQLLVPWMATGVAAAVILIWRSGWVPRLAVVPLLAAQIVWGGDVYFFPAHAMQHQSPIKTVADLMYSYYRNDSRRLTPFGAWFDIGSVLPKGAKVLIHHAHLRAGLRAMTVSDWEIWQGGISYGRLGDVKGVYDLLHRIGVTHLILTGNQQNFESLAGDLLFWQFATLYATEPRGFGEGLTLAKMPPSEPKGPFGDQVLIRACGGAPPYADGVYRMSNLVVPGDAAPPNPAPAPELPFSPSMSQNPPRAQFVVLKPGCDPTLSANVSRGFRQIGVHADLQLFALPAAR